MDNSLLIEFVKVDWSPELKRVYKAVPSAIRSHNWPEIARLANAGNVDGALSLARKGEIASPRAQVDNVVSRRMRVERVSLFTRIERARKDLALILAQVASKIARTIQTKGATEKAVPAIHARIDEEMVELRSMLRPWLRRLTRDSMVLGFRNAGNAFLPIFKQNREAMEAIQEDAEDVMFFEAKISIGIKSNIAKRDPRVVLRTQKWARVMKRIMKGVTRSTVSGLSPSEHVWELANQARSNMKRLVTAEVVKGTSPFNIAKKTTKFLSVTKAGAKEATVSGGPGIYKSPFRNAMRLARTEANRAYTNASASWADGKDFIKGVRVTLSPMHSDSDICDDLAKRPAMTPDEFNQIIPAHPHCMCYPTYVIDQDALEKEAA